jgi:hypothetical protein
MQIFISGQSGADSNKIVQKSSNYFIALEGHIQEIGILSVE